ncbi:pilus assembly protein PilP [Gammaproteobacteria bacterium 42_54_T18]|nr:pilus assembly protein PilP [Gammaproteobacteria bacterium 42_54_T18]
MDVKEFIDSLNNLDPENIGGWPFPVKALIWVLVLGLAGFGVYYFMLSDSLNALDGEQKKETELMSTYESKAHKAANLDRLKQQMVDMETSFGALLRQLPSDTEVPGLLEDISHTGLSAGLEFDTINLGTESVKEFYVELPIEIKVKGGYHSFGAFVSGVSALPRIVTLHDFSIKTGGSPNDLEMTITARTYRYNEQE